MIRRPALLLTMLLLLPATPALALASPVSEAQQVLNTGHLQEAADMLRQQVGEHPDDYQAWFLLGVAQARHQDFQQAIEAFRRVIELKPELAEPHNNLAVIYNELGDVHAAVQELEQSLQKRPGFALAEENLADLYLKLALQYYRKALEKVKDPALAARYARLLQVRDPRAVAEAAGNDMPPVTVATATAAAAAKDKSAPAKAVPSATPAEAVPAKKESAKAGQPAVVAVQAAPDEAPSVVATEQSRIEGSVDK